MTYELLQLHLVINVYMQSHIHTQFIEEYMIEILKAHDRNDLELDRVNYDNRDNLIYECRLTIIYDNRWLGP